MLDEQQKSQVKLNFSSFLEIYDRREELSKENNAIMEDTARILEVKKGLVAKLFRALKKKNDDAVDELGELSELMEEIFGE